MLANKERIAEQNSLRKKTESDFCNVVCGCSLTEDCTMQAPLPRSMRPGIVVVTRDTLRALAPADAQLVRKAIDSIGELSAKAQGLSKPITSHAQMLACDNRLYLSVGKDSLRGLLRVGGRQLFVHRKQSSEYVQTSPLCVLDFFVCTALQRGGEGRALFDFMCQREGTCAAALGYDRPSHKFLAFLRKHFDLASFIPQLNHFVVFDEYWRRTRGTSGPAPASAARAAQPLVMAPARTPPAAPAQGQPTPSPPTPPPTPPAPRSQPQRSPEEPPRATQLHTPLARAHAVRPTAKTGGRAAWHLQQPPQHSQAMARLLSRPY